MSFIRTLESEVPLVVKVLIAILIFTIIFNYIIKYPQLPKMVFYWGVREFLKLQLKFQPGEWNQVESDSFTIYYREGDKDIVPIVLTVSKEAYAKVNSAFDFKPDDKIPVMIYPDRASLNKSFGWDADVSAMGVYWAGLIKVLSPYVWIEDEQKSVIEDTFRYSGPIAHEYVHLVVDYKTKGNYPRWFTEGLAQYWEREITGFQFDSPEGSLDQELYPLRNMDRHFDALENQALAYSQSLAAIEYFYLEYGHEKLEELLAELSRGISFSQALMNSTGRNLTQFEKELHNWINTKINSYQRGA